MEKHEIATLAGGCFWCMEADFDSLKGVEEVISGYSGGHKEHPTYEEVSSGKTGHFEAVQITFNPDEISYSEILEVYWNNIDPTDPNGQFSDIGEQYKTAIFYHDENQKLIAEKSKKRISRLFDRPVVTKIIPFKNFYKADEQDQKYYKKCPLEYKAYKKASGREESIFSQKIKKLDETQYAVTQQCSTEMPFKNAFWDNKEPGIYVDIVSGEPLFSSKDKFDSGTGWPSFTKPLESKNIVEDKSSSLMQGVELKSKMAKSHLGHIFGDGPKDKGGLRYCINSASLRFIPKTDLDKEGYGKYKKLFEFNRREKDYFGAFKGIGHYNRKEDRMKDRI